MHLAKTVSVLAVAFGMSVAMVLADIPEREGWRVIKPG